MTNSIKDILKPQRPDNAFNYVTCLLQSAFLRGMPYYASVPFLSLAAIGNPAATLAVGAIGVAETQYLRFTQRNMRDKFNDYAQSLSMVDQSQIKPILNTLNERDEKEFSLSIHDLNPLERPLSVSFGLVAAVVTADPYAGVAGYGFALSFAEMFHLTKLKMTCLYVRFHRQLGL